MPSFATYHAYSTFLADSSTGLRPIEDLLPPSFCKEHGTTIFSCCVLVVAAGVFYGLWRRRARPGAAQSPVKVAIEMLRPIQCSPENGALAAAVLQALRRYFAAVLPSWGAGEFTAVEMVNRLGREESLPCELRKELSLLIRECERSQFFAGHSSPPLQIVSRAIDAIGKIDAVRSGFISSNHP